MAQVPQKDGREMPQKSEAWHKSFFPFIFYLFYFGCGWVLVAAQNLPLRHAGSLLCSVSFSSSCDGCSRACGLAFLWRSGLSWPMACGILTSQVGINLYLLHWKDFSMLFSHCSTREVPGISLLNIRPTLASMKDWSLLLDAYVL